MPTLQKHERLLIFCERLLKLPAFCSGEEAYAVLTTTLMAVEDEFSGIPNNPATWRTDGRLYPPQEDTRKPVPNAPAIFRYRSVAHNTFIGENGSIRIETVGHEILLNKAGADGRTVQDFERGGLTMEDAREYRLYAMGEELHCFRQLIERHLAGAIVDVDGALPSHCWIDIRLGRATKSVEFRSGQGFGIFGDAPGYGEGPAEICKTAEEASSRLEQLFAAPK